MQTSSKRETVHVYLFPAWERATKQPEQCKTLDNVLQVQEFWDKCKRKRIETSCRPLQGLAHEERASSFMFNVRFGAR